MGFWKKLLGIYDCASCGERISSSWIRTSKDLWTLYSSKEKVDKTIDLRIKIEVRGLCGKCFGPRADKGIHTVRDLFQWIIPPARENSGAGLREGEEAR